jgi:hypothetical protein
MRRKIFNMAAQSSKLGVLKEICNSAKQNLATEEVNKLLLATDNEGRTVLYTATQFLELEAFLGTMNP